MTTHTFPWKQVAESCPKAFELFRQYMDKNSEVFCPSVDRCAEQLKYYDFRQLIGYLEAFFDGMGIYVEVEIDYIPQTQKTALSCVILWHEAETVATETIGRADDFDYIQYFSTRQEAQIAGFTKAFSLLEQRLKGGEECIQC